jgi:hypothetical protein
MVRARSRFSSISALLPPPFGTVQRTLGTRSVPAQYPLGTFKKVKFDDDDNDDDDDRQRPKEESLYGSTRGCLGGSSEFQEALCTQGFAERTYRRECPQEESLYGSTTGCTRQVPEFSGSFGPNAEDPHARAQWHADVPLRWERMQLQFME